MNRLLFLLLTGIIIISCNDQNKPEPPAATPPPAAQAGEIKYPAMTAEDMQVLVNQTTSIDFIFYHQNFSMNLDNRSGIMNALRQIGEAPAPIRPECKATGRVIYQGDGEILKEADFYLEPPCFYFIFIENDKPVKANMMTQEGVAFFHKLISGVSTQPKQ